MEDSDPMLTVLACPMITWWISGFGFAGIDLLNKEAVYIEWACSLLQRTAETRLLSKEHSVGSGWNIKMNWHQYKKDTRRRNMILGTQKADSSTHNSYLCTLKHWMHVYTCHDQDHFILRKHKKEVSIKVVTLQRSHFVLILKPQSPLISWKQHIYPCV